LECVILCSDDKLIGEISDVISHIPRISAHFYKDLNKFRLFLSDNPNSFALIATKQNGDAPALLKLYADFPQVYFIYYYHSLNINNFEYTNFTNFSFIVIGENRIILLSEIILNLTRSYWKKIPYEKFNISYENLSPRLKRVMNYIETHDLKRCGTAEIADYLNISQGYFSQEFKRETKKTFRGFMQKLLDHYELLIFDRLKLSAKATAKILGYSELSSFSRSFKKRKGYPPSHQKNHEFSNTDKKNFA
jgi:AraC-like DNA-binding protein